MAYIYDQIHENVEWSPKPVNNIGDSTSVASVSGESLTLSGGAGSTGKIRLDYAPVMDSVGGRLGSVDDTSVSVGGTLLDGSEIAYRKGLSDTEIYGLLEDGDYAIDYENGVIFYKNSAAGTAETIDYKYATSNVSLTISDVEIGAVELKDHDGTTRADIETDSTKGALYVQSESLATESTLDDVKTAVELIDDLQGALKSVDADELITRVTDSTGSEINPAKEDGNLASIKTNTDNLDDTVSNVRTDIQSVTTNVQYQNTDYGTATSGGASTLTDSNKNWEVDVFKDFLVRVVSGDGAGEVATIASNTATQLTITGTWGTNPSSGSIYVILGSATGSGGGSSSLDAEYESPIDFTVTRNDTGSVDISAYPFTVSGSSNIKYVQAIDTTNNLALTYQQGVNDIALIWDSANDRITIYEAGSKISDIAADYDEFIVGIDADKKAYDSAQDILKVTEQALRRMDYTDFQTLVSASDIGTSDDVWKDQGSEISVSGIPTLHVAWKYVVNDSIGGQIKLLGKSESAGSDEYISLNPTKYLVNLPDANDKGSKAFDVSGLSYVQIQSKATDVISPAGSNEGTLDIEISTIHYPVAQEENVEISYFDSDGDNTSQALKTSVGVLRKLHVINPNSSNCYVQLFDAATGDVTVGTTEPDYVVFVPAEGATIDDYKNFKFSTAITYACTTTATGSGDPTTGLVVSALYI